jgi:ribonucleoside-diphosphate reductase alpha chain
MVMCEASDRVHAEKYRGIGEDHRECCNRIASALQDNHDHYMAFRRALTGLRFLPPGRVQAGAGSLKNVTLYNCFVMATIHDSFVDGPTASDIAKLEYGMHPPRSIMHTAVDAATTMRQGGGVGYDISTLRPRGDTIASVQSVTDGPMAFAPIYNAVCQATSSAGNRRGAQMLVLRVDHPDIEEFVRAKQAAKDIPYKYRPFTGFNFSVGITDEFMECVAAERPFALRFGGRKYREIDAVALWEMIMRGTYDWAEPGVLFIDRINYWNNLYYCETIAATNPCGEQPLPPYGACLLGSFNLTAYLRHVGASGGGGQPVKPDYEFDWEQLEEDIPHVVRAMDNVVDRSRYPLPQQAQEAKQKRRMGLGVTGLANAVEALLGRPSYGDDEFVALQDKIQRFITRHCYLASADLAMEKGAFPLFDADQYCESPFIKTLDEDVQHYIRNKGIRNSHLTSIAPTGTISFCANNVSSGIEPVLGYRQQRRVIMKNGTEIVEVEDYGVSNLRIEGRLSQNVSVDQHVNVIVTAQRNVDSAVSKTCNVPTDFPYDQFKEIYWKVFNGGGKGCTTYRPNGNYEDVIKAVEKKPSEEVIACSITGECSD